MRILTDENETSESDIISSSKDERPVLKEGYLESLLENDSETTTTSTSTSSATVTANEKC